MAPRMDERIGRRAPSPGLTFTWHRERRKRWRSQMVGEVVQVANVSASGAALVGPTEPDLQPQQLLELDCGGIATLARIKRIAPSDDPATSCYGVQFVDPPAEVIDLLLAQAGVPHRAEVEEYWNRAS